MALTTRTEREVFNELRGLCTSAGYIHAFAYLCRRDNFVDYGTSLTSEDFAEFFSPSRLIRTELSTLLGMTATAPIDFTLPSPRQMQDFIDNTDTLLGELHECLTLPMHEGIQRLTIDPPHKDFLSQGSVLREPIFYSSESAYNFQYRDLAPQRYMADDAWMKANKGFTIKDAGIAIGAIFSLQSGRIEDLHEHFRESHPDTWTFLPLFTFQSKEVAQASGQSEDLVLTILKAFSVEADKPSHQFEALDDFNITNAAPILQRDATTFILFQVNSIYEALYESPFFWMLKDDSYLPTALQNRGSFTEQFSAECLKRAFSQRNVYSNVTFPKDAKTTLGEIDVLVIIGDRAIVLQAKSKKLTLAARKGNDGVIKDDFKKSVQKAYDQARLCSKLLLSREAQCVDDAGQPIRLPKLKKIYLLCVISDHYPALSFQSRQFLRAEISSEVPSPFVMDIFTLDVMAEMLQSPLYFLSYIDRRTEYADKISASHELTILSFHLKQNLWMSGEFDRVMLHDDISTDLDVAMTVRRDNVPGQRTPTGILSKARGTAFERLIKQIEYQQRPETLDLGFFLLQMSGESISQFSQGIDHVCRTAKGDGNPHDFSMALGPSGVTVHSSFLPITEAKLSLADHVQRRKYKARASSWYGLNVSCLDGSLRFGYNAVFEWREDSRMAQASKSLSDDPRVKMVNGKPQRMKVGRNDPCPCRSGRKYKKCHGAAS